MNDRTTRLVEARRSSSDAKALKVTAALETMAEDPYAEFSVAEVARRAGVSRGFVYNHPDLRADIELHTLQAGAKLHNHLVPAARVSAASMRADLENERATVTRLRRRLALLEAKLGEHLGEAARNRLADYGLNDDTRLRDRIAALEVELTQTREANRRLEADLTAARRVNRDLMLHTNRQTLEATTT